MPWTVRKSTTTDADGRYALDGLLDAKYRVSGAALLWEVRPVDWLRGGARNSKLDFDVTGATDVTLK